MIYVSITIRNAFPCMDEPSFKATFSLQVGRPNQLHSLYIYTVTVSMHCLTMDGYTVSTCSGGEAGGFPRTDQHAEDRDRAARNH